VSTVSKRISVETVMEKRFVNITVIDITVRIVREPEYAFITNKRQDALNAGVAIYVKNTASKSILANNVKLISLLLLLLLMKKRRKNRKYLLSRSGGA
jgi:archaellum component FlaG (FlaF/FlaG flagellin family)